MTIPEQVARLITEDVDEYAGLEDADEFRRSGPTYYTGRLTPQEVKRAIQKTVSEIANTPGSLSWHEIEKRGTTVSFRTDRDDLVEALGESVDIPIIITLRTDGQ